jgi:hypothetical protein
MQCGLGEEAAVESTGQSSSKVFSIGMEGFEESVEIIGCDIVEEYLELQLQGWGFLELGLVFLLHSFYDVFHSKKCIGSNRTTKICYSKCVIRGVKTKAFKIKLVFDAFSHHFL